MNSPLNLLRQTFYKVEISVLEMFSGLRNRTKKAKNKCQLPQLQRKENKNDLAEKSVLKYLLFPWVC